MFGSQDFESGVFSNLFALIHVLPALGVQIRRLHDVDRTGWWVLLNVTGVGLVVVLAFAAMHGTRGPNRFGPEPDETAEAYAQMLDRHGFRRTDPAVRREPAAPRDPIAEVERLAKLHASGALTDTEFETMKAQALAQRA